MNDAMPVLDAPVAAPVTVNLVNGKIDPMLMDGETREMWISRLKDAMGTESDDLANYALVTMFKASKHPDVLKINAMLETVRAGQARDPQELLLLVQMAACAQRLQEAIVAEMNAMRPEDKFIQTKIVRQYGQLYCRQLEALRRYRRTGDQTISVIHVERADTVAVKAG